MRVAAQPPLPSMQRGSGSPVLFLHGMGLVPSTYTRMLDLLGQHADVVAPYWLYVEGEWSEHAVLGALEATVERGDGRPLTAVGHSFGGGIALAYAAARPDRVESLVLVDALGATKRNAMARRALSGVPFSRLITPVAVRDVMSSVLTRPRDSGRAGWWGYRRDFDELVDTVAAQATSVVVLWAEQDSVLDVDDGERLARRLGADFHAVRDPDPGRRLDHDWPYRRPALFVSRLLDVLPDLP